MSRDPAPDQRMQNFVTWDGEKLRQIGCADLRRICEGWPVTDTSPAGVAAMLRTSREMFVLAMFHYDLLVASAVWSLMATEAALREVYDAERTALARLVQRAADDGVLDQRSAKRLDQGRLLRNSLAHGRGGDLWTPGMAAPVVQASHELVAHLYPKTDNPAAS